VDAQDVATARRGDIYPEGGAPGGVAEQREASVTEAVLVQGTAGEAPQPAHLAAVGEALER